MSEGERQILAIRLYDNWQGTDTSDSLEIYCYERGKEDGYNKAIDECNKKLDELERNYKSCYGTEIIEMYADVYEDFRAWLKEQNE